MQVCPHTHNLLQRWDFSPDFFIEPETKILYYNKWHPVSYEKDYFLNEYKKSYGKTYLEDENSIRKLARRRLANLKYFLKPGHRSLLEIGCALGFFLDEAKNYIDKVSGIEISNFAVKYAQEKLGLHVFSIDLWDFMCSNHKKFDVIASFYVIEHFSYQKEIFEFISNSLNPEGIWICALPSTKGPLFEFHRSEWVSSHPEDHFVDYNPYALKTIMQFYNMKIVFMRPSSYHQERTKRFLRMIPNTIYQMYSDFFSYGDTLEFIAIKL